MNKTLTVKEYDTIMCNESLINNSGLVYIAEKHFRELEHFIKEYTSQNANVDVIEFFKIGYRRGVGDTISFNNYVGIVELPSGFQIEILPKVSLSQDDNNANTKRVFLKMLKCLKEFEGKAFQSALLNADRMNLYEVFIHMFIEETRKLTKSGIKSAYIQSEDNLRFFKGKLDVNKQILMNSAHREKFYMIYDEYLVNRPENKLVKSTLLKLLNLTQSMDNAKEIRKLLYSFELVDPSDNYEKDFSRVSLSRDMRDYELLVSWAKVFLLNRSITTFSGSKSGKALLFPMEQVFEAYIAKQIKKTFERESNGAICVSAQDSGYYLFNEPEKFRLRPDIVVRCNWDDKNPIIVMDAKWKRLISNPAANYGISQADMYQMYAYSKKYDASDIWLIYPITDDVKELPPLSFRAIKDGNKEVEVNILFVDLDKADECIKDLYDRITCVNN